MNKKSKYLFLIIFGLFFFTSTTFGQNPTIKLPSNYVVNLQEIGGNKGYPDNLIFELVLSQALPEEGRFIAFTFSGGDATTDRFGVWRTSDSLWVPPGTLRPKVYIGTLEDDNKVQKPYRFTITIENLGGYDTVGSLSFPVVVHSDDVFYIYSKPSQINGNVYEFNTNRVVDVMVFLDYEVRDKVTNQIYSTGTMSIQPGTEGASVNISNSPANRDLIIDIEVSSTTEEGVREFIKVIDNHFNKDSRIVEIHGPDYRAPTTTQSAPAETDDQSQQSAPAETDDQSQQSAPAETDDQSQQSAPAETDDQSQQSAPAETDDQSQQSAPAETDDQSQQSAPAETDDQSQQSAPAETDDQSQQSAPAETDDQSQQSAPAETDDQSQQSAPAETDDQSQQSAPAETDDQSQQSAPAETDDQSQQSAPAETDDQSQQSAPTSDFDGDGVVGIPDFLLFVDVFGAREGQANYDVKYDLDGNGEIGVPDFLIFVDNFSK